MELENLREELLRQHQQVRRLVSHARRLSTRIGNGGTVAAEANRLRNVIAELKSTLDSHWRFENESLEPILGTLDAWGPERIKRMQADHRAEHEAMAGAMAMVDKATTPRKLAVTTRAMTDVLLAHIEDEERYLLSRSVLTYEIIRIDQPTD